MLRYLTSILFLFVIGTFITACNTSSAREENKNKMIPATKQPVAEKITVKKGVLETRLSIPGELIAYQQVDLYAKVTGFVKDLKVDIGSKVKAGQVLLTLEAPELAAQMTGAESRLKSQEALYTASKANYNRLVETSKTPGTISRNDLDLAEAKMNSDLANLEAARAGFREVNDIRSYLVIRAPFDGTITARNVNVGAYVGPSGKGSEFPVLTLQQQERLRLVVAVPEAYTGYLRLGDEVSYKVRSYPSENFKAKIVRASGALDLKLRAQRVEADIDNQDGRLLPGTIAEVSALLHSATDAFVLPKSAVVSSSEGVFVVKVHNGKAERIAVKKGLDGGDRVEVFGPLAENDVVLKKASDEIKEGQEIE